MTPELILAMSAFFTAIVTAIITVTQSKKTAKKDEVDLLREEVRRLQVRIEDLEKEKAEWMEKHDKLHTENVKLREEKSDLMQILRNNGIDVIIGEDGRIYQKIIKKDKTGENKQKPE